MASPEPKEYEYHPPGPNDIRSPCPALNSLANHGLLNRDGRNITREQLKHALQYIGAGTDVAILLVRSAFTIHTDDPKDKTPGTATSGLRDSTDVTATGVEVLHLNRVGRPHATEHDVSITREDRFLGDPVALNPDLYKRFLASPREGPAFRVSEIGRYRKTRYNESKRDNPQLAFERKNHYVACAEVAAVQCLFGTGVFAGVPLRYVEALFGEERLPFREGWTPRRWKAYLPELVVMIFAFSHYAWPF